MWRATPLRYEYNFHDPAAGAETASFRARCATVEGVAVDFTRLRGGEGGHRIEEALDLLTEELFPPTNKRQQQWGCGGDVANPQRFERPRLLVAKLNCHNASLRQARDPLSRAATRTAAAAHLSALSSRWRFRLTYAHPPLRPQAYEALAPLPLGGLALGDVFILHELAEQRGLGLPDLSEVETFSVGVGSPPTGDWVMEYDDRNAPAMPEASALVETLNEVRAEAAGTPLSAAFSLPPSPQPPPPRQTLLMCALPLCRMRPPRFSAGRTPPRACGSWNCP